MVCYWQGKEETDPSNMTNYVDTLRANMEVVKYMTYQREREEKGKQNKYHDDRAKILTFSVGDFVLVFWPTKWDKLSNQWQNPFPIAKVITQ